MWDEQMKTPLPLLLVQGRPLGVRRGRPLRETLGLAASQQRSQAPGSWAQTLLPLNRASAFRRSCENHH